MNSFGVVSGGASQTSGPAQSNGFAISIGCAFSTITTAGAVSGVFSRRWLPDNDEPMVDIKTGRITAPWYRFFDEISENRLGGIDGPTLAAVNTTAIAASDTAVASAAQSSATVQAVNNNAFSAEAAKASLVAAGAPGASQIPTPRTVESY